MAERSGIAESKWNLCVPFMGSVITFLREHVETLAGTRMEISPSHRGYTKLLITGFESPEQARDRFQAVRTGLLAASLTTGMGIRIEDDVLVTRKGHEVLTSLPNEIDRQEMSL